MKNKIKFGFGVFLMFFGVTNFISGLIQIFNNVFFSGLAKANIYFCIIVISIGIFAFLKGDEMTDNDISEDEEDEDDEE